MGLPAGLKPGHGLQDEVIESLRPRAVQGDVRWGEDPTQATAMAVTPPDPGRALRAAPVAGLHSPERSQGVPARHGRRTGPTGGWLADRLRRPPPKAGRASVRDTSREQCFGDGFNGPGSVRSALVGDAREPGSGEARELATVVTPGVVAAMGKAGR
jgi:hypothetical protein